MTLCQCLKENKKQCTRESSEKSGHNPKFCWQHQNCANTISLETHLIIKPKTPIKSSQSEKMQIPSTKDPSQKSIAKPSLEIPTCYLYSVKVDRTSEILGSDVLYGVSHIMDKLAKCNVNKAIIDNFTEDIIKLTKNQEQLILEIRELIHKGDISGKEILEWLKFIEPYIITPQFHESDLDKYANMIKKHVENIKIFAQIENESNYKKIAQEMIFIIDQTVNNPNYLINSIGLLHLLWHILPDQQFKIRKEIELFLKKYSKITLGTLKLLQTQYDNDATQFAKKTKVSPDKLNIIIPKGTFLYKGVKKTKINRLKDMNDYFWLAFDLTTANTYMVPYNEYSSRLKRLCENLGYIGIYRTKNDLTLLNLSNIENVKKIKSQIQDVYLWAIFKKAFKIVGDGAGHETIKRESVSGDDLLIAKWLCSNGYDGYATDLLQSFHSEVMLFHSEVMLCHPKNHIEYLNYYDVKDLDYHYCKDPYIKYDTDLTHM